MRYVFPKHWRVLPFAEAVNDSTAGNKKIQKADYLNEGDYPIVDQGQDHFGGFTNDRRMIANVDLPAIVFGDHTRIFKYIEKPFCLGADGAKILEPKVELDKRFLFYYLSSLRIESAGYSRHYKFLKEQVVPVPPLSEQKHIAAILDKADAIRRKRQQAIQLADDFLRAVFLDMFGDPVTNPKGWDVRAVKEMAVVTTGNTPPRDNLDYYGDFIEWIKSDNINTPSDFLTVATEYLSEAGYMVGRHVAAGSTLLTCIAGSFDCIGNAAYADREVSFNQQINALTPKAGVNGIFLYALAKYCKKTIQAASTGGMKGMVSKGKLEEVRFIYPPASLQQNFAEDFYRYQSLRKKMERSLDGLIDGFSSISQKAFSGQL